jgi:NADP-dependent 3-hydroxy acid dehydrogenase YdfG
MTRTLLPKLLEKKGGVIINLSSSAAELDAPMLSVYNATKVTFSTELAIHETSAQHYPRNGLEILTNH